MGNNWVCTLRCLDWFQDDDRERKYLFGLEVWLPRIQFRLSKDKSPSDS
jgi:hypothetical protein